MKTATTSPAPAAEATISSLTAALADRRDRASLLTEAMQKLSELYWSMADEQEELHAEGDAIEQQIEDHIAGLESMVKYRTGDPDRYEGHKTRRKLKKFQRRAANQHRQNGLAKLSDSTHVSLVLKSKRKAKRDRECDKTTTRIRKAQLRKQAERGLNPAEVLSIPECRREREAYYAELAESRRIAIIAACTSPDAVNQNLNGECHDHYTV